MRGGGDWGLTLRLWRCMSYPDAATAASITRALHVALVELYVLNYQQGYHFRYHPKGVYREALRLTKATISTPCKSGQEGRAPAVVQQTAAEEDETGAPAAAQQTTAEEVERPQATGEPTGKAVAHTCLEPSSLLALDLALLADQRFDFAWHMGGRKVVRTRNYRTKVSGGPGRH